jgi:hypothetical protein
MSWKQRIAGCFGETDCIFAGHSNDEKRAFELLGSLRDNGVGWREAQEAFEEYLESKNCNAGHIEEQVAKVETYMAPWLLD